MPDFQAKTNELKSVSAQGKNQQTKMYEKIGR